MSAARKKLCIVTPTHSEWFMGGAQYQIKCLLDVLIPLNRFQIYYLARRVPQGFTSDSYQVIPIGRRPEMPRLGYIADAIPLYRALAKIGPDVIYQRVGCGYTGIAAYYASRNGARLTWHVAHDNDVMRESLRDDGNPIRRKLEKRSIEYGINHADHIVTQTAAQAHLLEENYGRRADAVIQNFQPDPAEIIDKSGQITVIWVANLKRWKQPEPFIRLAERLRDLSSVRFVMVGAPAIGSGERDWNSMLMRRIAASPNLEYLGRQSQAEVNGLLARAHVFVNTSRFEGFANTFIQAWMREVPVVSLHVNPDSIFDHEEVGFCAGTEDRLADVVRDLVLDNEKRARIARQARAYASVNHSTRNALDLLRLIEGDASGADTGFGSSRTQQDDPGLGSYSIARGE